MYGFTQVKVAFVTSEVLTLYVPTGKYSYFRISITDNGRNNKKNNSLLHII